MRDDRFNLNIQNLQPSASMAFMAKAKELQATDPTVINLTAGEPDFDTPAPIVEEAYRQMKAGFTHYVAAQGLPELRNRIARKLREENGAPYEADEILVTPGGKNAIYLAVTALVNPGDEVLILDPAWVSYFPIVQAAGAIPVPVVLDYGADYRITETALEEKYSSKTKLLIINYPNNPTGKVLSAADAAAITAFMERHPDVYLLSDEVYERIVYDGFTHICPASIPSIRNQVIIANGFSKSVAMTGWRLGYLAAERSVIRQVFKLYQHSVTCVSGFIQKAAVVALDCGEDVERMRRSYQHRRDLFFEKLNAIDGVDAKIPEGAFYAWLRIDKNGMSSAEICDYLLREARVVGVPGDAYGVGGEKCLRFSFAEELSQLLEAADRIKTALDKL